LKYSTYIHTGPQQMCGLLNGALGQTGMPLSATSGVATGNPEAKIATKYKVKTYLPQEWESKYSLHMRATAANKVEAERIV
jgi:hypothetical protein